MEDRDKRPRSGVPLTHYVIAMFIAGTAACLLFAWLNKKATESSSAVLAFDPTLAQHLDSGLTSARKPAIALAESILNDQAIAGLAERSQLSSSTPASRIGEFRSGLELTQPSFTGLRVRFLDSDSERSAANANAVAQALAAWMPSGADTPAATAQPQRVAPPDPSAERMPAEDQRQKNHPDSAPSLPRHFLSDSLGEISAQLAAINRDLDRLAGEPDSAYTQFRQQQLLKTQVNAAEKKLDELREHYEAGDPDLDTNDRLAAIQQAVHSILRAGEPSEHSANAHGFRSAGTSSSQLRLERSELSHAISVVDDERQAIEQSETRDSAFDGSSQAASPQQAPHGDSGTSEPQRPFEHPLRLVRLASPTTQLPPQWPAILAGVACGLLYLGIAAWAHRAAYDEDYDEVERAYPRRFIAPYEPNNTPGEHVRFADLSETRTDAPEESINSRRAISVRNDNDAASVGTREEALTGAGKSASREENAETVDPISDQLRKTVSETSIGRLFEGADRGAAGAPPSENISGR